MYKKIIVILVIVVSAIFIGNIETQAISPSSSNIYEGIDISSWQGSIDFTSVAESGISVVYMKASQGTDYVDPYLETYYQGTKSNGMKVGFYHYLTARTTSEAQSEAEFFVNTISGKTPDCLLAMDFESFGDLSNEQINQIAQVFLQTVENLTGKGVVIYSDAFNASNTFSSSLNIYPLGVADYGVSEPQVNANWNTWVGFQYTDQGEINGISGYVDRNEFTDGIFLSQTGEISGTNGNNNNSNSSSTITIVIQQGDTLSGIANEYGTTVATLVELNNIQNPNLIYAGSSLIVPVNGNISTGSKGLITYTIQSGDTLGGIASRYGTTVAILADLNNIQNPNLIYAGDTIEIPASSPQETNDLGHTLYTVQQGDTLSQIALKYGVTVDQLVTLNQIANPNLIFPGEVLRI